VSFSICKKRSSGGSMRDLACALPIVHTIQSNINFILLVGLALSDRK
jgi:hypothetical protein